jgi:phospholipase/carboxylesterase
VNTSPTRRVALAGGGLGSKLFGCLLWVTLACSRAEPGAPPEQRDAPAKAAQAEAVVPTASDSTSHVTRTIGGTDDQPLPWIVALHGLGDTPESFIGLLNGAPVRAHVYALCAPYPYGDGHDWYRVKVDGDPEKLSAAIQAAVDYVMSWMVAQERDTKNQGKPIVLGFSQGGMLSFALGTTHPDRFQAVIPIAGMLPQPLWPKAAPKAYVPIYALHGSDDRVIPLGPTQALVAHLEQTQYSITLDTFPGVAHKIPGAVRSRVFGILAREFGQ